MKRAFIWLCVFFTGYNAIAQQQPTASDTSAQHYQLSAADSQAMYNDLATAIQQFRKTYKGDGNHPSLIFAYAAALSVTSEIDSAFKYLGAVIHNGQLIKSGSELVGAKVLSNPDFSSLHCDKRWEDVVKTCVQNIGATGKELNWGLAEKLWEMKALDQSCRNNLHLAETKIGFRSQAAMALKYAIVTIDMTNQQRLDSIVQTSGWPKISEVGEEAAEGAFLIVQHTANVEWQKKYLSLIKKYCEHGEAYWQNYAELYDRIKEKEGKPQKYGSQFRYNEKLGKYELYPLENISKVEQWRKEKGLEPLAEYAAKMGVDFKLKSK